MFPGDKNDDQNNYYDRTQAKVAAKQKKHGEALKNFDLKGRAGVKNGMATERVPRNCLMLIIFLGVLGTMIGLTAYSYKHGNFKKLVAPVDGALQICGFSTGYEEYNKLYVTDLDHVDLSGLFKTGVCVKSCPQSTTDKIICQPTNEVPNCQAASVTDNQYETVDILGYCFPAHFSELPETSKTAWTQLKDQMLSGSSGKFIRDVQAGKEAIYICCALAIVYNFLFIYARSKCATCIFYAATVLIELSLFGGAGAALYKRSQLSSGETQSEKAYLWAGIGLAIAGCLYTLVLCCFWRQMRIAVALIGATADFFAHTKRVIFVSIFYFFVTLIIVLLWLVAAASVSGLNAITASPGVLQGKDIAWTAKTQWMLVFMGFGLIWLVFFIQDKTAYISMVAASSFYFSSSKDQTGSGEVLMGVKYAYLYNSGSLATGSLIHAIVFILKVIVEGLADYAQKTDGKNPVVRCLACCAKCCVGCLSEIVDYVNKGAYAYMAITGDAYCKSAWDGYLLSLKHTMEFLFANTLAYIFGVLGKLVIVCLNCLTCWWILCLQAPTAAEPGLAGPLVLVAIVTFLAATIFLSTFDDATNATLHCLAFDMELNDGVPQFGPPSFHEKIASIFPEGKDRKAYGKVHDAEYNEPPQRNALL